METVKLRINKKECKDKCPIPLELIPNVEKGFKRIQYDKKTKITPVTYDEGLLSEEDVMNKLRKIGYMVKR